MAEQAELEKRAWREEVGHTGIYPASGPRPTGEVAVRGQGALAHPEERRLLPAASAARFEPTILGIGRAIFGGFFLYNGINHFLNRRMIADYARSKNVPVPEVAVAVTGGMLALGGLSLITGVQPKVGAALISSFLLGVSPQMHDFWNIEDQQQRLQEMVNFTKNMALVGGACFAAAVPEPWAASPSA